MRLTLRVTDRTGMVVSEATGNDETWLVHSPEYQEGDVLGLETDVPCRFVVVQFDDAMKPALCFLKDIGFQLPIPGDAARPGYSPRAFSGREHYVHARAASPEEISQFRNLALNPYDWNGNASLFPHATASVETRNEAGFAARNAIDGEKANSSHGAWPFTSWGINRDPMASLTLDFGHRVLVDRIVVYLRADFPHDSWWTSAKVTFSEGKTEPLSFVKTPAGQVTHFPGRLTEGLRLHSLVKADDESPFPALTQIEVHGRSMAS